MSTLGEGPITQWCWVDRHCHGHHKPYLAVFNGVARAACSRCGRWLEKSMEVRDERSIQPAE